MESNSIFIKLFSRTFKTLCKAAIKAFHHEDS